MSSSPVKPYVNPLTSYSASAYVANSVLESNFEGKKLSYISSAMSRSKHVRLNCNAFLSKCLVVSAVFILRYNIHGHFIHLMQNSHSFEETFDLISL